VFLLEVPNEVVQRLCAAFFHVRQTTPNGVNGFGALAPYRQDLFGRELGLAVFQRLAEEPMKAVQIVCRFNGHDGDPCSFRFGRIPPACPADRSVSR